MGLSSRVEAQGIKLDLQTAIKMALERNLELKAKSEELGTARGRVIKSNLFLQQNPELEGEVGNFKVIRGEPGFGRNNTNYGFSLSQEFEIGGQSTYRREGAQRNLDKVRFEIGALERTLRFRDNILYLIIDILSGNFLTVTLTTTRDRGHAHG